MKRKILIKEEENKEDDIKKIFKNLINIGMIEDSKSIRIIQSGLLQKNRNVKKNPFCTNSHKFYLKDKNPKTHQVGHSLMRPMDLDGLFKRMVIIR